MGGGIAFLVALITTPGGVSGAVLLLPVQVSVLHAPNPALTPTTWRVTLTAPARR